MSTWRDKDLSSIDLRSLPPEAWGELKAEVHRRARAERSAVARSMLAALRGWMRGAGWCRRIEARSYSASNKRPLYLGGRA